MKIFSSYVFLCFASLFCASALFFYVFFFDSSGETFRKDISIGGYATEGYAVLTTDSSVNDRYLRALLTREGDGFTEHLVSESSQWVLLDSFDSLEVIPLDEYSNRIYPFDPRNDGYAEKLGNIFVRDGKRFAFIPVNAQSSLPFDSKLDALLEGISYNIEYFYVENPHGLFLISYAAACFLLLIICFIKKNFREAGASLLFLLPVLCPLAFYGVFGIALAAVFLGLAAVLREPLKEFFSALMKSSENFSLKSDTVKKNVLDPYTLNFLLMPFLIAAIAVLTLFAGLKAVFALLACVSFCAVLFLTAFVFSQSGINRRRFVPVRILRRKSADFSFSAYIAPFAAAAVFVLIFTPYVSGAYVSDKKFDQFIEEQDYYGHIVFQSTFSRRQFDSSSYTYPEYFFDADGLPSPVPAGSGASGFTVNLDSFPSFPLNHLMDFFRSVNDHDRNTRTIRNRGVKDYVSLFILFCLILPGIFIKRKDSYVFNFRQKTKPANNKSKSFKLFAKGGGRAKTPFKLSGGNNFRRKDA